MTKKQFKFIKLAIVILLAISVSTAVNYKIAYLPPIAILISVVLIQIFYRKVNEVTADERDYQIVGKSARTTLTISTLALAILGSSLLACSTINPAYYNLGQLSLYIVCGIMIINIISYAYYQRKND